MAFIVRNNCIATTCHSNFQEKVIGWIRQKRAPKEKNVLLISYMTAKVNEIADVVFGNVSW